MLYVNFSMFIILLALSEWWWPVGTHFMYTVKNMKYILWAFEWLETKLVININSQTLSDVWLLIFLQSESFEF